MSHSQLDRPNSTEIPLGQVILPASDGVLSALGHVVSDLKEKALGVIVGHRGDKSLVKFPELNLTLWIANNELCDVQKRADSGDLAYQRLVPKNFMGVQKVPLVWTLQELIRILKPEEILSLEKGTVREFIPEVAQKDHGLTEAQMTKQCWSMGLAIPQWIFGSEERLSFVLGSKLIWARLIPSGMHKIELVVLFESPI